MTLMILELWSCPMLSWANITTYEFALTVEHHTIVSLRVAYIEVVVLSNVQLGQHYSLRICIDRGRTPYNSMFTGTCY